MQRTEVYIATCALNVGHIKRLKCFINQNLTSHYMSNWMKWHVFGNDERKTWDDAPRQHVSKLDFSFWIDNIRDHDLVIFLEAESNCCFCKIDCCVKIFDSEKGPWVTGSVNTLFAKEIDSEKRPWVTENVRHHLLKTIDSEKEAVSFRKCECTICWRNRTGRETVSKKKVCGHHLLKKSRRKRDSQ